MKLTLFHASSCRVENPDTKHSRNYLDFGRGFYLTSYREQAEKYAQRFLRRQKDAYLNTYLLEANEPSWKLLRFESYDKEWLDFVSACRSEEKTEDYDLIIGGIANDKVILTLDLYFNGQISQDVALDRLKYEHPNIQYCIRSERMLNECLTFIDCQKL